METFELFNEINAAKGRGYKSVDCLVKFVEDGKEQYVTIKLNTKIDSDDDKIFFYCNGLDELKSLCCIDNGEDFTITSIIGFD